MNLEQRLRASLVAPDPGAAFTARVMAEVARGGKRRGRRFFVVGAVLVAGLAAAMLAWHVFGSRAPAVATVKAAPIESTPMPASAESPAAAASEEHQEDPLPSAPEPVEVAVADADPAAIRIVLMPAQQNSQDTAAKPAIDAFHSSLLQALRRQPGVVVEVAGARTANDQPANQVVVVSPRYTTLPSGRRLYQSGDGRSTWQGADIGNRGAQQWPVEVILKLAALGTHDGMSMVEQSVNVEQFIDGNGILTGRSCSFNSSLTGDARPDMSSMVPAMCSSVEGVAAALVATLRPQPPPPVADITQLVSRLSDPSTYDRPEAFRELLNRARRDGVILDAAAIKVITAYLASQTTSDQRFSSVLVLRGMRQPGLVAPLLDVLERDGDEKVRIQALSMLIAEYGSDSRVRPALESVARLDASALVRMVAQRPLSGDAPWQSYVVNTLADKSLTAANRLAPAQHELQQAYAQAGGKAPSWLGSEQVTRQLVDLFQELRPRAYQQGLQAPPGLPPGMVERMAELGIAPPAGVVQMGPANGSGAVQQQDATLQSVLTMLGLTNPAAETDLRISILTESPAPPAWLAMNSLNALMEKRDNPRVSKVLDDIASGKAGPELRSLLERNMAMRPGSP